MTEQKAMAYVNLYGILGALENLCAVDAEAKAILQTVKKPISICFSVKDGPCRTFHFSAAGCRITEGSEGCTCKMQFASPAAFNRMIDTGKPGMPTKGVIRLLLFMAGPFVKLTDRLAAILRPTDAALADRAFFEENTLLTLYVVAGAISGLANSDSIARISASNTPNGDISLGIRDSVSVTIRVRDHVFTTIKAPAEKPRALMEFSDLDLAYGLFNGKVSTVSEMCKGNIRLAGVLSMVDNVNRILDRVSVYLG